MADSRARRPQRPRHSNDAVAVVAVAALALLLSVDYTIAVVVVDCSRCRAVWPVRRVVAVVDED